MNSCAHADDLDGGRSANTKPGRQRRDVRRSTAHRPDRLTPTAAHYTVDIRSRNWQGGLNDQDDRNELRRRDHESVVEGDSSAEKRHKLMEYEQEQFCHRCIFAGADASPAEDAR